MNIIERVKQIINEYPDIAAFSNDVHIDYKEAEPGNFGLSSLGDSLVKKDVIGNELRQHTFVLYAQNQSFNDFDRLSNSGFLLNLAYYLETVKGQQLEAKVGEKSYTGNITKMWSANGMLYSVPTGNLADGVTYQLQIYAQYKIVKE